MMVNQFNQVPLVECIHQIVRHSMHRGSIYEVGAKLDMVIIFSLTAAFILYWNCLHSPLSSFYMSTDALPVNYETKEGVVKLEGYIGCLIIGAKESLFVSPAL